MPCSTSFSTPTTRQRVLFSLKVRPTGRNCSDRTSALEVSALPVASLPIAERSARLGERLGELELQADARSQAGRADGLEQRVAVRGGAVLAMPDEFERPRRLSRSYRVARVGQVGREGVGDWLRRRRREVLQAPRRSRALRALFLKVTYLGSNYTLSSASGTGRS